MNGLGIICALVPDELVSILARLLVKAAVLIEPCPIGTDALTFISRLFVCLLFLFSLSFFIVAK